MNLNLTYSQLKVIDQGYIVWLPVADIAFELP